MVYYVIIRFFAIFNEKVESILLIWFFYKII